MFGGGSGGGGGDPSKFYHCNWLLSSSIPQFSITFYLWPSFSHYSLQASINEHF
jgi:hypothetical protein